MSLLPRILRCYPFRFGLRVLRILPQLQATGCRSFPEPPPKFDPLRCYMEQDFTDLWTDAAVPQVLRYLRGNVNLRIPESWRGHLMPEDL